MNAYRYLIIGGGMTADAAVRGIRALDADGAIGLICDESDPPYGRPPLSKGLWKGRPVERIWRRTEELGATLHLGRRAVTLNPVERLVTDDQGEVYRGERILLATGGSPRRLPFGGEDVIYFRTLTDYHRLRTLSEQGGHIAVIGGGFIGAEIAAALATTGSQATMIFPETGIGARIFPRDLAEYLNSYYREKGVTVLAGEMLSGIEGREGRFSVKTQSGLAVYAGGVVAGIGTTPNTELAKTAGLAVAGGIVVDEKLQTSQVGIYAAGDVAEFFNPAMGKRMRVEHEDNALQMGQQAGRNMAGANENYRHLPYFYSDLFELGYEAIGEPDPRLETFADWQEPYRKGVIYTLDGGRVRGVVLWNVWDKVETARALIAEAGPFRQEDLKGRIK